MKITFDLKAKIYVPDADFAPEKENLEALFSKLLWGEGMHVKSLSVENYKVDGRPKGGEKNGRAK